MKKIVLLALVVFLVSCVREAEVVYDVPFDEMAAAARETGRDFCVVISRPDCPPCAEYVKTITNGRNRIPTDVTYNIVDVSQPENMWYSEWLCLGTFPTTCLFSDASENMQRVGIRARADR